MLASPKQLAWLFGEQGVFGPSGENDWSIGNLPGSSTQAFVRGALICLGYFCPMYEAGQKVRFLEQQGRGSVTRVEGNIIWVEDEDGFEQSFQAYELVPDRDIPVKEVRLKDLAAPRSPTSKAYEQAQSPGELEVDLHFDKLVDFPKNYDSHRRLQLQLHTARKTLDKARRGRIKKVIIIHGVGQGLLKEEVHKLLERMEHLSFYDANYARYGRGATEVELH